MCVLQRTRNPRRHKLLSVGSHRERRSGPLEEDEAGACRGGKSSNMYMYGTEARDQPE